MKVSLFSMLVGFSLLLTSTRAQLSSCDCWLARDSTWQIAAFDGSGGSGGPGLPPEYRNDDWSTSQIFLPFFFCFYNDSVAQVYINNNGCLSIGSTCSSFYSWSFPFPGYSLIAPFWSDVDTRAPLSGIVYYKIFSNYLAVQWDHVGYYGYHDDQLNTFQLIISDGGPSPLPQNNNVGFCYGKMEWACGDASQGTHGFGGAPAQVGVNYGDGTNCILIGMYNDSTDNYDGPFGLNDGIQSLSNQSISFNLCGNSSVINSPPIFGGQFQCDTLQVCSGDTFVYAANFISPEDSQITSVTVDGHGLNSVSLVSTPDNKVDFTITIIPSITGFFPIDIIATDDGTPLATTTYSFILEVKHCTPGITELAIGDIFISPNPFENEIKYLFAETYDIIIADINGKRIFTGLKTKAGIINTEKWKVGIYFMIIQSGTTINTIRIVKN